MIGFSVVTQVGLYHDQQAEDGGSSKENRNIYSESMPRRVGSFYRGDVPVVHCNKIKSFLHWREYCLFFLLITDQVLLHSI